MKKTKRQNRKFRNKGGGVGYIPFFDDKLKYDMLQKTKHKSDINENRSSLQQKIFALKELISWIELSLFNIGRAAIKSAVPIFTQGLNRALFNKLDENWTSKNLVTQKQMDDYKNEIDELNTGEENIEAETTISGLITSTSMYNRKKYLGSRYVGLAQALLRYLKQLHILITRTSGPFASNNFSIDTIQLGSSIELPVSEKYRTYLEKKLGVDYLHQFQTNYDVVSNFLNEKLKPTIREFNMVDTIVSDEVPENETLVDATRLSGGARKKTNKKRLHKQRRT
jgi:hypothetical protein